jgi:hypothetical protein
MSLSPAGAPVGVPGKIGNGCQLISANSQYLTHADTVLLQVTSDFTFSLWVRIDIPDPDSVILSKYTQDLGVDYVIDYASSIGFYFAVAGDNTNAAIAGTVATGVWTHGMTIPPPRSICA